MDVNGSYTFAAPQNVLWAISGSPCAGKCLKTKEVRLR
jgi:hypothetical protein